MSRRPVNRPAPPRRAERPVHRPLVAWKDQARLDAVRRDLDAAAREALHAPLDEDLIRVLRKLGIEVAR